MRKTLFEKIDFLTFGLFGFLFLHFAKEMLQVRPDGWYVGQVNLYGDLVFHLSLINKFLASGINIDSPIYAGDKINYPIIADFLTAQVSRVFGIDFALFIVTLVVGVLTLIVSRLFVLKFVKDKKVVFLAFLLFFLNGGVGFYYFLQDFLISKKSIADFLYAIPRQYTDIKEIGYWWINSYLAYFLPQRAFLFAFPITLIILLMLYLGSKTNNLFHFAIAGIMAGTLPLVQAHSLLVLFLLSVLYFPINLIFGKEKKRIIVNWALFGFLTIIISYPLFGVISSVGSPLKYIRFAPGWTSKENLIWFWFKNLGFFAPTLIAAVIWLFRNKKLFILYIPFLFIFVMSNIFVFQPWEFDNSKLLIYWYFASCIVVAYFLREVLFKSNIFAKTLGLLLVFLMIFAGSIDVIRTFTPISSYQIFSKEDLQVAQEVQRLTPKNSVFVTSTNHNHPIPALSGRSTLLGFPGWVWSHGTDYLPRQADVVNIYQGGDQAEVLIKKYHLNFVTLGPQEKVEYSVNLSYFDQYPKVALNSDWILYDVSSLWSNGNR